MEADESQAADNGNRRSDRYATDSCCDAGNRAHRAVPRAPHAPNARRTAPRPAQRERGAEPPVPPTSDEETLMASIRETRRKLMPAVIALAVLDLAGVGYLLSPAGRSRQARQHDYDNMRQQLVRSSRRSCPLAAWIRS